MVSQLRHDFTFEYYKSYRDELSFTLFDPPYLLLALCHIRLMTMFWQALIFNVQQMHSGNVGKLILGLFF